MMVGPSFRYTHVDDEPDWSSIPFAGTEPKRGRYIPELTNYLHAVSTVASAPSSVYIEPHQGGHPSNDWLASPPIQAQRSAAVPQFDSGSFALSTALRAAPIPLYTSRSPLPPFGYSASFNSSPSFSVSDPRIVAMPTLTGFAQYGGGLIDAQPHHHEPSFGFPRGGYTAGCPRAVPSPSIAMPIVPTSLGADASSHIDPALPPEPILGRSLLHSSASLQHAPLPASALSFSLSGSFDSVLHSSPSPPLSTSIHALAVSTFDTLDQNQPRPSMTSSCQLYTITVPLEAVEFPTTTGTGEAPFFLCLWAGCGVWITSDKEAVKNHLARTHNVMLRGKPAASACCAWVGCSSSLQRNGLVRHFQTHLGLKWLCSLCKTAYTRQDSVGFHAHREPGCQLARAISSPSAAAYRASVNADNTVTLTKILQP